MVSLKSFFRKKILFLFLILIVLGDFGFVRAAFNEKINYQGKLTNTSGVAVANGSYNIRFRLCTISDCSSGVVWTETLCYSSDSGATCTGAGTDQRVAVTGGLFSVLAGNVSSLSAVDFNQTLYLEVQVGGSGATPSWETLTPRKTLGAVPAAFEAKKLGGKTWAIPDAIGSGNPAGGAFTTFSSTGLTTVGNSSATVAIDSSDWDINTLGAMTGISGITSDSTYTQTAGDFAMSGAGTFGTGTGAISLNGDTTIAAGKNLALASGAGTFVQTFTGTTTTAGTITANSLTSGNILSLTSTSTAAIAGNTGLNIAISGTNGTSAITRYGLKSAVTAAGTTSTNVAGYFSATGGTTANYGLIVENGSVGIGTTAPVATLSVGGVGAGTGTAKRGISAYAGGTLNVAIEGIENSGVNSMYFRPNNSGYNLISSNYLSGSTYLPLSLSDRETNSDFVIKAGSIGIGTTSPTAKLHLADTTNNMALRFSNSSNASAIQQTYATDDFDIINYSTWGTQAQGAKLRFFTNNDTTTPKMVIQKDGSIGIGDTTPDALFSVGATSQFQINSSGQIAAIAGYTQGSGNFAISGAGTFGTGTGAISLNGDTTIAAGKNLALASGAGTFVQTFTGTTTTAGTITANSLTSGNILSLTSTSTAAIAGNTGLNIAISGTNGTSAITRYGLKSAVTAAGTTSTNVAGYFSATGGTTANYGLIVENGSVGIGTTAPASKLVVKQGNISSLTGSLMLDATYLVNGIGQSIDFSYNSTNVAAARIATMLNNVPTNNAELAFFTSENALTVAGTEHMRITGVGNVGIGTTGPESRVQISGGGLCVGSDANCNTDNNTEGIVYSSATAMTLYDVAENYPTRDETLQPAEVVVLDISQNGPFVKRGSAGEPLLGVVSAAPAVLMGGFNGQEYKEEKQVAVALSGRVPVKVTLENGPIKAGDYLTSSSIPGAAMRAIKAGRVIGIALESYDINKTPSGSPLSGGENKVMVFVNPHWYGGELTASGALANADGEAIIAAFGKNQNFIDLVKTTVRETLASLTGTVIAAGEWTFEKITAKQICIEDVCVNKNQLQELLNNNAATPAPTAEFTPASTPEITPIPTSEIGSSPIPSAMSEASLMPGTNAAP